MGKKKGQVLYALICLWSRSAKPTRERKRQGHRRQVAWKGA